MQKESCMVHDKEFLKLWGIFKMLLHIAACSFRYGCPIGVTVLLEYLILKAAGTLIPIDKHRAQKGSGYAKRWGMVLHLHKLIVMKN